MKKIFLFLILVVILTACDDGATITPTPTTPLPKSEDPTYQEFSGDVYVSLLQPNWEEWEKTGWKVSADKEPRSVESLVGTYCEIFPLKGVSGQFVGRCVTNFITVPVNGAEHLQVIEYTYKDVGEGKYELVEKHFQLAP